MAATFRIGGEEYPVPILDRLTLPESVVINQATGLSISEVVEHGGETLIVGLVAVALKRGNPTWTVQAVMERLSQLDTGSVEVIGTADPEDVPPPNAPDATSGSGGSSDDPASSDSADELEKPPDA